MAEPIMDSAPDRALAGYHLLTAPGLQVGPFDPNGSIYYRGLYHLFFIHQPRGRSIWGHATSKDLIHWKLEGDILTFGEPAPEAAIFSGNLFVDRSGVPTIAYHGQKSGNHFAYSTDPLLRSWIRDQRNPLYVNSGKVEAWDPFVWHQDGKYHAIFGGQVPYLLTGPSLDALKVTGPLFASDRHSDEGEDVSCPRLVSYGDRDALFCISHRNGARVFVGKFDGKQFRIDHYQKLNWPGGAFFAPEVLSAPDGRKVMWAWLPDPRPFEQKEKQGILSLPREVTLAEDNTVEVRPLAELTQLRGTEMGEKIEGDQYEIEVEFAPDSVQSSVTVLRSPDDRESTSVIYDRVSGLLQLDHRKSSLDAATMPRKWIWPRPVDREDIDSDDRSTIQTAPLKLRADEPVRLRIFVDRTVIEVFANDRLAMSGRVFPTLKSSRGCVVRGNTTFLNAWKIVDLASG